MSQNTMYISLTISKDVWNSFSLGTKNFFTFHSIVTKDFADKITAIYYNSGYFSNDIKSVLERDKIQFTEGVVSYDEYKKKFDTYGNYTSYQ